MRIAEHGRTSVNAHAIRVQFRVLYALMIREAMTRYGHKDLGFFWLMGDQLILTCGVIGMWSFSGMGHSSNSSVGVIPMAVTGYAFIQLFRHIVSHAIRAIHHGAHLLYHQKIKVLDLLLANSILETIGIISAFIIAYIPLSLFDLIYPMHDPLLVAGGFLLTAWFSFAVGLIVTGVTELSDAAARIVAPTMYVSLPFSGLFFMVHWLPDQYRNTMLWSPMVSCIEMIRGGIFPDYMPTFYSPLYVVVCCTVLTAIGVPLVAYAQEHASH